MLIMVSESVQDGKMVIARKAKKSRANISNNSMASVPFFYMFLLSVNNSEFFLPATKIQEQASENRGKKTHEWF